MSECECPVAGYCAKHKRRKSANAHKLCQTRSDYRALWDRQAVDVFPDPADDLYRNGPGTQLGKLLKKIGITEEPDCPCRSRMAEMDRRGCQWCRENLDTIVGWLREEYDRRRARHAETGESGQETGEQQPGKLPWALRLPFSEFAARRLILHAIRLAEKLIQSTGIKT